MLDADQIGDHEPKSVITQNHFGPGQGARTLEAAREGVVHHVPRDAALKPSPMPILHT